MTTIVFAAHADDEVIGCGGTIAKLAKKEKVIVIIFSYGSGHAGVLTSWPPFLSQKQLKARRIYESNRAGVILGVHKTIFLGVHSDIDAEFDNEKKQKLIEILKKYKPNKVFFHSNRDIHPDHIAVNKIVKEALEEVKYDKEMYTYQINMFDTNKGEPKIIYDISREFPLKVKALLCFKSQIISLITLMPMIILKSIAYGKKYGKKYVEYFYGR